MKKKIINGLLFAVALVAATSSFVSCKDYEGDNYAELQEKYASLKESLATQQGLFENYLLKKDYKAIEDTTALHNWILGIQGRLGDYLLKTDYKAIEDTMPLHNAIVKLQDVYDKLIKVTGSDTAKWNAYKGQITTINETLDNLIKVTKEDTIRWNLAAAVAHENNELVLSLSDTLTHFVLMWGNDLTTAYANAEKAKKIALSYDTDTATINRAVEKAQDIADKAWNYVNQGMAVDKNGETKANLQAWVKYFEKADEELQDQIDDLNNLVNELNEKIKDIEASLMLEVTGIEIQATNNPIFGSFAYPIDVQSNILALYYGEVVNGGYNFPVGDKYADLWVGGKAVILDTELSDIAAPSYPVPEEGILMNEGAGNAGKLYLTVNPSNVNFEGKNFSLRTSDNQVSKVTLSGLEPCTEQLTWGYHRASSANGFYVATAEVKKNDVKSVALSFDLKGVSSQVQNIMQDWSKTKLADIAKLAATVAQNMKIDAPRLGVQAQWKDPVTGWKNYVSKYDLAAVSVRPLSFHDLYNADYSPAIVKLRNKLTAKEKAFSQELINEIKAMINVQIGLPATAGNIRTTEDGKVFIDINDNVTIPSVDFKTDESSAQITIKKGQFYPGYDDNGNLNDLPAGMSYIPTTDEKIKIPAVTGSTYPSSTYINTSIEITSLFNAIVDGIKKSLSGVNKITDKIENIVNRIINIQNKIFGKVESVLKNPNRFLQPALFASKDNSFFYPSRIYSAPTKVKQGTKLMFYPSSLNAEIVAPAFKKYVAVCGAWEAGNIDNTTSAKKFNTGAMNTVFDGNEYNLQKPFEYTLNAPVGTVIEIIYECLGYDGKVAGKKYYIEVAE